MLLAIAVVVLVSGGGLLGMSLRLDLSMRLGTDRYLVLWHRCLLRCRILARRGLRSGFILSVLLANCEPDS
jgi:hypothetical protein